MGDILPLVPPVPTLELAIARAERTGEEFCVSCYAPMGFPWRTTGVEDPIRFKDGACYVEGGGQVCALCAQR